MTDFDDNELSVLESDVMFLSNPALDGRYPGSKGHRVAEWYIQHRLWSMGLSPLFLDGRSYTQGIYDENNVEVGRNICGVIPGKSPLKVLVCAHYDHVKGCPGADDNAASVGIALAVAELIVRSGVTPEKDLVFCFFDLEELPNFLQKEMGSRWFVEHPPFDLDLIDCSIVMDLVGHDNELTDNPDDVFVMGAEEFDFLDRVVRDRYELPLLPVKNERVPDMSDHAPFRWRDIPYLFLSCGWSEHYHKPTDVYENLNMIKTGRMVLLVQELVNRLSGLTVDTWDAPTDFDEDIDPLVVRGLIFKSLLHGKYNGEKEGEERAEAQEWVSYFSEAASGVDEREQEEGIFENFLSWTPIGES